MRARRMKVVWAVTVINHGKFSAMWSKVFDAPKYMVDRYVKFINEQEGMVARADRHMLRDRKDPYLAHTQEEAR